MEHETDFKSKPRVVEGDFVNSIWCYIGLFFGRNSFYAITALSSSSSSTLHHFPNDSIHLFTWIIGLSQLGLVSQQVSLSLPKIKLFLLYWLYQYKFKASYGDKSRVSDLGHYRK